MLHAKKAIELGGPQTNGHIWAVCYDDDNLYIDFFHGRSDGAGVYSLVATLLYYYFDEGHIPGIKTLDSPVSEAETHDPVDDLPLIDLGTLNLPASPRALNVMEASGLDGADDSGHPRPIVEGGNCTQGHGRHLRCCHLQAATSRTLLK